MLTPTERGLPGGTLALLLLLLLLLQLQSTLAQFHFEHPKAEGSECATQGDHVWTCRRDCYVLQALESSAQRITCFRNDSLHLVCCPPPSKPNDNIESISQRKCLEYQSICQITQLGSTLGASNTGNRGLIDGVEDVKEAKLRRKKRGDDEEDGSIWASSEDGPEEYGSGEYGIYNGQRSAPGEFPHSALIGYGEENSISWKCGGTLISERYVLSAAHCNIVASDDGDPLPARWVRLGDLNFATDEDRMRTQQFSIVRRIPHEDYNTSSFYNDIILFELDRDALFDRFVAPACLYTDMADPPGVAIATGWGYTEKHKDRSTHLMKVDLNFIPHEACNNSITKLNNWQKSLSSGVNRQTMICAWKEDKDTCQGDSGGPLVLADKGDSCLATLVGITSFGPSECDYTPYPAVYVRVANFIPWIESIVWPDEASNSGRPTN